MSKSKYLTTNILIFAALAVVSVGGMVFVHYDSLWGKGAGEIYFSEDASLKELAIKNGIKPGELRFKLGHETGGQGGIPMQKPVKMLGIETEMIKGALAHSVAGNHPGMEVLKFGLWWVLSGVVVLWVLGRSKIDVLRKVILVASVVVFGVILGPSPNPMESVVKFFKTFKDIQGSRAVVYMGLAIFSLLSIWSAKLVCSWGCHLGALQETLFNIAVLPKKFKFKVPFALSIAVRLAVFLAFVVLLFNIVLKLNNFVLYHHVNYFKLFRFKMLAHIALISLPVAAVASFFVFRPFCQFICPFGLWAWVLENVAINKVRVNRELCTSCNRCAKQCPTEAMKGILKGRKYFRSDCWSCGKCIESCPSGAVDFGIGASR